MKWDVKSIERHLFGAGEAPFQTGWFMESITTQVRTKTVARPETMNPRPHIGQRYYCNGRVTKL